MANDTQLWYRRIFPTAHKVLLDRLIQPLFKEVKGDVLVIGAGKVNYRKLFMDARSVIVTDIDPGEFIDKVVDAHSLPFENGSLDTVVAIEVFEHLRDPDLAMNEIRRVLREDGRVLLSAPFMFRVHGDPHDYQRFTSSGFVALFGRDFEIATKPFGNRIHVVSDIISTAYRPLFLLRVLNHILCLPLLSRRSNDCPSGYVVEARKSNGNAIHRD